MKYSMAEDETSTYTVMHGETVLATQEINNDCLIPSAEIVDSCESAGALVTLTNGGVLPVEFIVLKNGTEVAKKSVIMGSPQTLTFPMDEDETATFLVQAEGETMADVTRTFKHDCQMPSLSAAHGCDKGVAMVFSNAGELPVDFTITKGGHPLTEGGAVSVPAEGSVSQTYTLIENETATFVVSAPGLLPVSFTFTQNCQNPVAAIGSACPGPLVVTLTNSGGLLPVDFTVLVNGVSSTVNVPANGKVESPFELVEDAPANVKISAMGMTDTSSTFVRDCADVLGITLTQPAPVPQAVLPRTGSQPVGLALFAGALAVLGLGLRRMTRRSDSAA